MSSNKFIKKCVVCRTIFQARNDLQLCCSKKCSKERRKLIRQKYWRDHREDLLKKYKEWARNNKEHKLNYLKERRLRLKLQRVKEKGGKCERCNYKEFLEVLEFHHKNPETKQSSYDWMRANWNPDDFLLLCSNCHQAFTLGLLKNSKESLAIEN